MPPKRKTNKVKFESVDDRWGVLLRKAKLTKEENQELKLYEKLMYTDETDPSLFYLKSKPYDKLTVLERSWLEYYENIMDSGRRRRMTERKSDKIIHTTEIPEGKYYVGNFRDVLSAVKVKQIDNAINQQVNNGKLPYIIMSGKLGKMFVFPAFPLKGIDKTYVGTYYENPEYDYFDESFSENTSEDIFYANPDEVTNTISFIPIEMIPNKYFSEKTTGFKINDLSVVLFDYPVTLQISYRNNKTKLGEYNFIIRQDSEWGENVILEFSFLDNEGVYSWKLGRMIKY